MTNREFTLDHRSDFVVTGDAINAVFPAGKAGVLSASILYFNFGDQAATDVLGNTLGSLYSHAIVVGASYAATFGDRFSAGLTYKWLQQSQTCGGSCPGFDTYAVSASAFDFGVHAVRGNAGELTLGAAIRNVGTRLQFIDTEQADPLPTRLHLGGEYRVDAIAKAIPAAKVRVTGEVVTRLALGTPSLRGGAELSISDRFFLRGGLISGSGDGSTASFGFGVRQGTLGLDFARTFGGLSSDAGTPPTYVTVRVAFR